MVDPDDFSPNCQTLAGMYASLVSDIINPRSQLLADD